MNEKFLDDGQTTFSVDKGNRPSAAPAAILWITFIVALLGTFFLFFQSKSVQNNVTERESNRDAIVTQLSSNAYVDIETKANTFKKAFEVFSSISSTLKPKKELMDELYTHFTKDVKINNLAISNDGTLQIDGYTASYRCVADFMTGLKAYNRISSVSLGSVSVNESDDDNQIAENQRISFSVTAILDTKKEVTKAVTDTTDDSVSEENESESTNDYSSTSDSSDSLNSDVSTSDAAN